MVGGSGMLSLPLPHRQNRHFWLLPISKVCPTTLHLISSAAYFHVGSLLHRRISHHLRLRYRLQTCFKKLSPLEHLIRLKDMCSERVVLQFKHLNTFVKIPDDGLVPKLSPNLSFFYGGDHNNFGSDRNSNAKISGRNPLLGRKWTSILLALNVLVFIAQTATEGKLLFWGAKTAEEVSFAANGITAAGLKSLNGILQTNITLTSLDLSGNPIGDEGAKGAKAIAEMLKKNSSLRIIELNNNTIDYSGFTSLAGALLENKTMHNLHLSGNYGGALGANAFAKGLEGNKSLRELHLHGNSIGDEGVRVLVSGLSLHRGKLAVLDISNNSISAKGAYYVAEYVRKNKSLLWLNLYMNDIGDEGAQKIADALKENRSIKTIDLGGNNIHANGVSAVARVLKDNLFIENLELGYNPIGPDGAKALTEVLKFHGNIKTLKLGWCQIGAKGAEFIADCLKYNKTISVLDLRASGLRDEGAIFLARSLKVVNEALNAIDLGFNEIRDDGAFAISQALKSNEDIAVASLNLANNFLTKFGQTALSDAMDHVYEMTEKEINIFY